MKTVAIIGAGQLGSRHLQSLALYKEPLTIFIIDPSKESLKNSGKIFNEVDVYKNKSITFSECIDNLPVKLDFVIIATNSKQRLSVIQKLLNDAVVNYLLLEKFLFPKIDEYAIAIEIVNRSNVKAYVNCGRRLWPSYQKLKKEMLNDTNVKISVIGSNWNLSSNAIHFLDLFFFITNDNTMEFDASFLDGEVIKSKRVGYIDFTGTLIGKSRMQNTLTLTSSKNNESDMLIKVESDQRSLIIDEGSQEIMVEKEIKRFPTLHVSDTTHKVFEELIENNSCKLVTFERSVNDHLLLLTAYSSFLDGREGAVT